jgi:hypothetical protein
MTESIEHKNMKKIVKEILEQKGFKVKEEQYISGKDVDLFAVKGDKKIVVECQTLSGQLKEETFRTIGNDYEKILVVSCPEDINELWVYSYGKVFPVISPQRIESEINYEREILTLLEQRPMSKEEILRSLEEKYENVLPHRIDLALQALKDSEKITTTYYRIMNDLIEVWKIRKR